MARVTLSGVITDINGSIGGWTFQDSLAGKTVRIRPVQHGKGSSAQLDSHFFPTQIRYGWSLATSSQQGDWIAWAAATPFTDIYGNVKSLSGYQLFASCVLHAFLQDTFFGLDAPSAVPAPDALEAFTIGMSSTVLSLEWAMAFDHPDHHLWVFATPPVGASAPTNRRLYKLMAIIDNPNTASLDITAYWEALYPYLWTSIYNNSDYYLHLRAFLVRDDSGLTSLAQIVTGHN